MASNISYDYFINDDIVYFELHGRGKIKGIRAMVSLDKWPVVCKYKWYLSKTGYVYCFNMNRIHLHRFIYFLILGEKPYDGFYIDHIDRNPLNNTDENLRLATPQENSFNKSTKSNTKGVRKISENNYTASITKDGIKREIKNIQSEKQAAEIYNMMAEELFGDFASKNKI